MPVRGRGLGHMLPKMTTIFDGPMRVIGLVEGSDKEYELQHLLWNKTERAHVKMLKPYIMGSDRCPQRKWRFERHA